MEFGTYKGEFMAVHACHKCGTYIYFTHKWNDKKKEYERLYFSPGSNIGLTHCLKCGTEIRTILQKYYP